MINIQKKYFYIILFILNLYFFYNSYANIVVSIKPIGFIVEAITDGIEQIEVLLPDGASEHDYSLKPSDLKKIKDSKLLIWIGPEIENFLIKPSFFISKNSLMLSSISQIQKLIIYSENKNIFVHKNKNMHLWLSPKIVKIFATVIYEKLLKLFPQKKEKLYNNIKFFEQQLNKIDKKIKNKLQIVKQKKYFVFHDAFAYFEKHYGLLPFGFITMNPLIQPGIKSMNKIKKQIIENKIVCIFSEPQYKNNFIKKLYNDSIKTGILDPLGFNIPIKKNSYLIFLSILSNHYIKCLK